MNVSLINININIYILLFLLRILIFKIPKICAKKNYLLMFVLFYFLFTLFRVTLFPFIIFIDSRLPRVSRYAPRVTSCILAYSPTDRDGGGLPVQMWQHETFIHFGYITVDIIGCVDGKYEHNSADATCQDFAKIPLCSPLSILSSPLVSV